MNKILSLIVGLTLVLSCGVAIAGDMIYAVIDKAAFVSKVMSGDLDVPFMMKYIRESSIDTARHSLDGSQFIIHTDDELAQAYLRLRAAEESIPYTEYTHAQILNVVKGTNWTESVEE